MACAANMAASIAVLTDVLSEFLEVAIHGIIYSRNIYPNAIYESRKKYNAPVKMSTHPELNEYIGSCISSIRQLLSVDALKQVIICIWDSCDAMQEKIVFQFSNFNDSVEIRHGWVLDDLEQKLRGFLLRIYACDVTLGPPLSGCRFAIKINAKETEVENLHKLPQFQHSPWIDAEMEEISLPNPEPKMIPMKSLTTDYFSMQLYAEQMMTPHSAQ